MNVECSAGVMVKETPSTIMVPPIFMLSAATPFALRYLAISVIATVFLLRATVSPI